MAPPNAFPGAAATDRDGEHVRRGDPAVDDAADLKRRVAVAQGDEIPAIAEADAMIRRKAGGCDQPRVRPRRSPGSRSPGCSRRSLRRTDRAVRVRARSLHRHRDRRAGRSLCRRAGDGYRTRASPALRRPRARSTDWRPLPARCRARTASHRRRTPAWAAEPMRPPVPTRPTGHRLCRRPRSSPDAVSPKCRLLPRRSMS